MLLCQRNMQTLEKMKNLAKNRFQVLQERLLSPRLIHFGPQELMWECNESAATESHPCGLPDAVDGTDFKRKMHFLALDSAGATSTPAFVDYSAWEEIVHRYSRTQLTKITDKLIALSGLAKRMQAVFKSEYIAGLWRQALPDELLWSVIEAEMTIKKSTGKDPSAPSFPYIAPSWSWASVDRVVKFWPATLGIQSSSPNFGIEASLIDVQLEYLSNETTDIIKRGHIDLQGWMRPIDFGAGSRDEYGQIDIYRPKNFTGPSIDGRRRDFDIDGYSCSYYLDGRHQSRYGEAPDGDLYCMLIGTYSSEDDIKIAYLLLRAVDSEQGVYERFGTAIVKAWCYELEEVLALTKAPITGTSIPCRSYRDGMYTIRII